MESSIRKICVFSFMVLYLVAHATSTGDCNFPAIINFGDSNSDTGTVYTSAGYGQNRWEPLPLNPLNGRASDGRLIVDFLAESFGFPHLDSYINSMGTNFSHGVNFACGGATIRQYPDLRGYVSYFNLQVQKNEFEIFVNRTKLFDKEGVHKLLLPQPETISRALFTIDIGQNDLSYYDYLSMSKEDLERNVTDIINSWTSVIKVLHENGARSFWIHNSGPFGCLPTSVYWLNENSKVDEAGCAVDHNELVQYFNSRLKEAVVELRKNYSTAAFTYVDIYKAKYTLISQAKENGFEGSFQTCCGFGGKYNFDPKFSCGAEYVVNDTKIFVGKCENPSVRISWDGTHYTEAANKWVFNHIVNGSFSDPPIPLNMACHRQGY